MKSEKRTEPCGCVVTTSFGHVHTKMCKAHAQEYFKTRPDEDNLDLVGG